MRTLVIAACLAAPVVAHADPLADAPRTYIASGVALGSAGSHGILGASFEVGERVTDHLIVHAEGLGGGTVTFFGGSGDMIATTGGIDATSCNKLEKVCAYAGLAAGYGSSKYTESDNFFDAAPGMTTSSQGAIGLIRVGFDIGNRHIRWRPSLEASLFGPSEVALTNSVALAF
jgi:hypothetical protein